MYSHCLFRIFSLFVFYVSFCRLVSADKMKLTALPKLITLYPETGFSGYPFVVNGFYETCYDFQGHVESVSIELDTEYCDLWVVKDCGEGAHYEEPTSQIAAENEPQLKKVGIDGVVRSLRCFEKDNIDRELK